MLNSDIVLTGIKPTGNIHLGNYLGAIKPTIELAAKSRLVIFMIADLHALITIHDPEELKKNTAVAENFLNTVTKHLPNAVVIKQSKLPQISELSQILACFTPKGLLNRSHAYKAATATNHRTGIAEDAGVSTGLFTYPVLMSADILAFSHNDAAIKIPVGADQVQHIEVTKAIVQKFNAQYGPTFTPPEAIVLNDITLKGTDGRKMSKSYNNTIPFLVSPDEIKKSVASIVTDSLPLEEPKDPDTCSPYLIYKELVGEVKAKEMYDKLRKPGYGYGHAKADLLNAILAEQDALLNNKPVPKISNGNAAVFNLASSQLANVKRIVGLD